MLCAFWPSRDDSSLTLATQIMRSIQAVSYNQTILCLSLLQGQRKQKVQQPPKPLTFDLSEANVQRFHPDVVTR